MKPIPDCIPGILEEVLTTSRLVAEDLFIHRKVMTKVMSYLVDESDMTGSRYMLLLHCIETAYKALGVKDPYEKEKARLTKSMNGLSDDFRSYIDVAPDPLRACLNLLVAGRMDGLHILGRKDMEQAIFERMDVPVGMDESAEILAALRKARSVMIICNAAGETVLDRVFLEHLPAEVEKFVVVSATPVLTRATRADAELAGLEEVATILQPGAPMYGVSLTRSSREFQERFASVDLVIAKGEINYETLAGCGRDIIALLQCACPDLAGRLGVDLRSSICAWHKETNVESA